MSYDVGGAQIDLGRTLDAHVLLGERRALPGSDAHFAGTFQMCGKGAHATSVLGEVAGQPGLRVVDGSAQPSLPAKLTIMANADRIAAALARDGVFCAAG